MSLERYRRSRMIVLSPRASAREAARAMADNHVGAIVVAREQRVVGVVTDRDIALEICASDLSASATPLHDIMSDEVAAVDVGGTIADVVHAMIARKCRRIVLVQGEAPAGIVTLDDLTVDGAVDPATLAAIVRAQLEAPAPLKAEGALHPESPARPEAAAGRAARAITRRRGRAATAHGRLLRAVELHTGITSREHAELAVEIVLGALCRRVTPDEARHLLSQLPSTLQSELGRYLDGPDRRVTRESIEAELVQRLHLDPEAARFVAVAVCEGVADCISAGEIEELRGQLPLEMKDLFPPTWLRKAG